MQRPEWEVADIINHFGKAFVQKHQPNAFHAAVLETIAKCRTAALGGHKLTCNCCNKEVISYNSCRNRNCPKCQTSNQLFWAEDRMEAAFNTKHYHMVFTVPEELNTICMLNSSWFYSHLFKAVWDTLHTFGYSHFGVESGAICVLHTWGQNLSLHPHVHCIVPAVGLDLKGNLKPIGKNGKYLYPVRMLSATFRGKMMQHIKYMLKKRLLLLQYQQLIDKAWAKPWVVFCEPSMGKPEHVIGYLSQYTHRVAISNHRIMDVDNRQVTFSLKDYRNEGKNTILKLDGVEFLRRFCMHILPLRFVRIRYYGIYSSKHRKQIQGCDGKMIIKIKETTTQRLLRLTGFDAGLCQGCKKGRLVVSEVLPRIRSPGGLVYNLSKNTTDC